MQKSKGFIQNFIIPGIIVLGVVLAGVAVFARPAESSASNEKAALLANVIISNGEVLTAALLRAELDNATGVPVNSLYGRVDATNTSFDSMYRDTLVPGGYLTALPKLPASLPAAAYATRYSYANRYHSMEAADGTQIGTVELDSIVLIPLGSDDLSHAVCRRINARLLGTDSSSDAGSPILIAGTPSRTIMPKANQTTGCARAPSGQYRYFNLVTAY